MFARITHVITNEIINNAIYIRKAIGTTVLKLEGIVFFLQIFFACSVKNISTKFLFDILPARYVFKILLKFNFKAEALLRRIKVVQLSL